MEKQKKEVVCLKVQQLDKKRKKETEEKAWEKVKCVAKELEDQEERGFDKSQKSPSPQMEEEEQSEQGGDDQEKMPFYIKQHREQKIEG